MHLYIHLALIPHPPLIGIRSLVEHGVIRNKVKLVHTEPLEDIIVLRQHTWWHLLLVVRDRALHLELENWRHLTALHVRVIVGRPVDGTHVAGVNIDFHLTGVLRGVVSRAGRGWLGRINWFVGLVANCFHGCNRLSVVAHRLKGGNWLRLLAHRLHRGDIRASHARLRLSVDLPIIEPAVKFLDVLLDNISDPGFRFSSFEGFFCL